METKTQARGKLALSGDDESVVASPREACSSFCEVNSLIRSTKCAAILGPTFSLRPPFKCPVVTGVQ